MQFYSEKLVPEHNDYTWIEMVGCWWDQMAITMDVDCLRVSYLQHLAIKSYNIQLSLLQC